MKKRLISRTAFACMIFASLCWLAGKAMAQEVEDRDIGSAKADIIMQIQTNNSDYISKFSYASNYVAERVNYLISSDTYKRGSIFPIRDIDKSIITDDQTGKKLNLKAAECYGYARYVYFMIFGTFEGKSVSINEPWHSGAHIRTNSASKVGDDNKPYTLPEHSLIFLSRDEAGTGSYFLDANWSSDLDNVIRVEHWSDNEFSATFSNGIKSITEPQIYPRTGDYLTKSNIDYFSSPTDSDLDGEINGGTVLHVSKLDTNISSNTKVKFDEKSQYVTFRAIMAEAKTPEGKTIWIVFNEPGVLEYLGPVTNSERPGSFFQSIWVAISNFFRINVKPVHAASEENLSSLDNSLSKTPIIKTPSEKESGDFSNAVQKVMVLNFDPVFQQAGGLKQHNLVNGWYDPNSLAEQYISDMDIASHGNAVYEVVEWNDLNELPRSTSGFSYSVNEYYSTLQDALKKNAYWDYEGWRQPNGFDFDYDYYLKMFDVYKKVEQGNVDEVWIFIGPCTGVGAYESIMIGRDAYFCNSSPMIREDCPAFVCYAFNYERDVGCMLEDAGHRMESIMKHVYGRWDSDQPLDQMNDWELFTLYDKASPGNAACGNVHFAPNSTSGYDWGNSTKVLSTCNDWTNYPELSGKRSEVNCSIWGNGNTRQHHIWWFDLIPHVDGVRNGVYNNWWIYFLYPTKETQSAIKEYPSNLSPHDLDSNAFMFVLHDLENWDWEYLHQSPINTGYASTTDGGYILKCELMEFVEITYDDYQVLLEEVCLDKIIGNSLWEISYFCTGDTEGDLPILLDISIDGSDPQSYCLYSVPSQDQPATLMYIGQPVKHYTGETKQFFIAGDTIVSNLDEYSDEETFSDYLENGGHKFGYNGEYKGSYADYYYAEVSNGVITRLSTDYGVN